MFTVYNRPTRLSLASLHQPLVIQHLQLSILDKIITMKVAVCMMVAMVLVATTSARPQQQQQPDGGWVVKTDQTRNGGTVVRTEANKQWDVSKDGKVKAEVHGHWERTYGGPNNGQRDRGVGGSIGGSWG